MSRLTERLFGATTHSRTHEEGEEHWISVSDLMAGLMMVFLFISIALMRSAFIERDKIKEVAITYQKNQVALYNALMQAFRDDLPRWDADIEQATLSFQFKSPDVLFDTGQITLKPAFQAILNDFFPRYLNVLTQFRNSIDEVRIEGHTSSLWNQRSTPDEAYFNNMELSQGRTRAVLEYVYTLPDLAAESHWVKKHVAAVGFSSSRIIQNPDGAENIERSRRVSFRVMTNAETQIRKILER